MKNNQRCLITNTVKEKKRLVVLLTLFPCGFVFFKFYLGETKAGLLYLLFFLTNIPVIVQLFEVLFIGKIINAKNLYIAQEQLKGSESNSLFFFDI